MNEKCRTYSFLKINNCNMCGAATEENLIIGQRLNKSVGLTPRKKYGISVSVMRCRSCGLIYANPLPIPADIQDHYGIPPDEYWVQSQTDIDLDSFLVQIEKAKRILGPDNNLMALDIGVGQGKSTNALLRAGFDTYGIEPSESFRNFAIKSFGLDPEKLKLGTVEEADYPENFFDFITFGAVLEHLYNPSACIAKAMKWLRPGGIIQIEVPSANHLISKLINYYYRISGTNYVTNLSPMHVPFHLYEFDLKSFEKLSKELNYDVIEYYYIICEIYHLPKFMHPFLRFLMQKNKSGMQLEVWLKKRSTC